MTEPLHVEEWRFPFVTIAQAAFFLQKKQTEARHLYEIGGLPHAKLDDGTEFKPVAKVFIPASELWSLLSPQAREHFREWQLGNGAVPSVPRMAVPPHFEALYSSGTPKSHGGASGGN